MPNLFFADAAPPPPADAARVADGGSGGSVGDEVNEALMTVLPWGISIVFHAAIVLLAVFAVYSTVVQSDEEEIIIPVLKLGETPGAPLEMTQIQTMDQKPQEKRTIQQVQRPQEQKKSEASGNDGKVGMKTLVIGSGGLGGGGKGAPFNTTMEAGAQFKTAMFGAGGNAKKIVFVIDATGSLIDSFPFIVKELTRTVNGLSERQSFAVIFYNGEKMMDAAGEGLRKADDQAKKAVIEWIAPEKHNIEIKGKGNPVKAIQKALRMKPDLLFLLSDNITGQGQYMVEQDFLLSEIKRANASNTKINTIQFIYKDPMEQFGGKPTMQLIAEQTGGIYKFVSEEDLNLK